jgi:hypothetical protein
MEIGWENELEPESENGKDKVEKPPKKKLTDFVTWREMRQHVSRMMRSYLRLPRTRKNIIRPQEPEA